MASLQTPYIHLGCGDVGGRKVKLGGLTCYDSLLRGGLYFLSGGVGDPMVDVDSRKVSKPRFYGEMWVCLLVNY